MISIKLATTIGDYTYIAYLYNPGNNKFLIRKKVSLAEITEEGKYRFDYIISNNSQPIGWFALMPWKIGKKATLVLIIDRKNQGKGVATALWPHIIKKAKKKGFTKLFLEVLVDHEVARHVYRKAGFREIATVVKMEKIIAKRGQRDREKTGRLFNLGQKKA